MKSFIAIDVETANADMASICQIGIAKYSDNKLIDTWETLVNPEDEFDEVNISIHGISEKDVKDAPTFPEVLSELSNHLTGTVSVCHTHFDRVSIGRAIAKHALQQIETTWLDSARVTRRAWPELSQSGYGLANVCKKIGYEFDHHNALEDAKASGQILLSAMEETGWDLDSWLVRVNKREYPLRVSLEGNPEGDLAGEVIVFTGSLGLPRNEAAEIAANMGCKVEPRVTKKTTILVVGDQDILKLNGKQKSSKHLKAEKLILKGRGIRILRESDFKEVMEHKE